MGTASANLAKKTALPSGSSARAVPAGVSCTSATIKGKLLTTMNFNRAKKIKSPRKVDLFKAVTNTPYCFDKFRFGGILFYFLSNFSNMDSYSRYISYRINSPYSFKKMFLTKDFI